MIWRKNLKLINKNLFLQKKL